MNKEIIKGALQGSLRLISQEYQCLDFDAGIEELKEEYEMVIEEIVTALEEFII